MTLQEAEKKHQEILNFIDEEAKISNLKNSISVLKLNLLCTELMRALRGQQS